MAGGHLRAVVTAVALLAATAISPVAQAAQLEVIVTGLRSSQGNVHIAVYDNPETFPDSDGMLVEEEVPIAEAVARKTFAGLKPGRFAVAVYHDENDNDDFDQGFLGIPLEDYAFSSGARAFLGPPSFAEAAFAVDGDTTVRILIDP